MQNLGYNKPLYILPFDHRNTFYKNVYNTTEDSITPEQQAQISEFKQIIYDGFKAAVAAGTPQEGAAILVDEQYGDPILKDAKASGFITILTLEKTGAKELTLEQGDAFGEHVLKYQPQFAKILLQYNADDDQERKNRQHATMKRVCDWCHANGVKFFVEPLVPPTQAQLTQVNNDKKRYDIELRPLLTVTMIKEIQDAGIEVDVWKLEGLDKTEDYQKVVAQIRANGRTDVSMVILGRGGDEATVSQWLRAGASVEGVIGFAVGRTVFWDSIVAFHEGKIKREQAVEQIADNFNSFTQLFLQAKG